MSTSSMVTPSLLHTEGVGLLIKVSVDEQKNKKGMMKGVKGVKKTKTWKPLEISVRKAGPYISDFVLQMLM